MTTDAATPAPPAAGARSGSPLLAVLRSCRAARPALARAICGGIAENGFGIVAGAGAGWLVGAAAAGLPVDELGSVGVIVLAAVVLAAVGNWVLGHQGHAFAFRAHAELRLAVFDGMARGRPGDAHGRRSGDVAAAAMGDVEQLEGFFAHLGIGAVAAGATGVAGLIALAALHPALALVAAGGMVAVTVLPLLVARRVRWRAAALRAELGAVNADVVDGVQGLRELLVFGHTRRWYARIAAGTFGLRRHRAAHARATGLQQAVTDALVAATSVAVLVTVIGLYTAGQLTLPAGVMAVTLATAALGPVTDAVGMAGALAPLRASARRVLDIINQPALVPDTGTRPIRHDTQPEVRFESVSFRYPGRERALSDVDIDIPAGHTVALVGPSGAGKSTCVNLLLRFYDPDAGRITVDGHDLRDYPLRELHRMVTVVAQDVYLFTGTVADNLRLARPGASDADLQEACRAARAHEFVTALPQGYHTPVGERGALLSGGQRQRLTIARALLADTPILVLDEAASNLDTENEHLVQQALAEARRDRTTLVVAHRLSTVRAADQIVVLDAGRVVETGRHQQLLHAGGRYAQLMAHQTERDQPRRADYWDR